MSEFQALAPTSARAVGLSRPTPARAEAAPAWPRTIGLTIAFGISIALWAAAVEGGIKAWSLVSRL